MAISDFNPDQSLRNLPSLQVEQSDGTIIPIPAGTVHIVAGTNMVATVSDNENVIILETAEGGGTENPYFRDKYEALANTPETGTVTGGGGAPDEPSWSFSAAARWLAALSGAPGTNVDHNAFILNSLCTTVGLFDQVPEGQPEATAHILRITDQCAPATNLLTVKKLLTYVNRLKDCFDYMQAVLDDMDPTTPATPPDGMDVINAPGFLQQMQTMRHYWNYLVHRAAVKFGAGAVGQGISFSVFFRNTTDAIIGTLADGVVVTVTMSVFRRDIYTKALVVWSGLSPFETELRPITRDSANDPPSKLVGYDVTFSVIPTKATATYRTDTGAIVYRLPPQGELYCDGAILFKNMDEFDDGAEYVMRMTATVATGAHMGDVSRTIDVYFTPPIEPESDSSDSSA